MPARTNKDHTRAHGARQGETRHRQTVGSAEDKGRSILDEFLKPYERISVRSACRAKLEAVHLDVWVYKPHPDYSGWQPLPESEVRKLWSMSSSSSLCKTLMTNMFQLSPEQYSAIRKEFANTQSKDVVGLYRNGTDFAVVVRLPPKNSVAFDPFLLTLQKMFGQM